MAYQRGEGVPKNVKLAARYYRQAAEGGRVEAMTDLGVAYWYGRGVPKSIRTALSWYRKAASSTSPLRCTTSHSVITMVRGSARITRRHSDSSCEPRSLVILAPSSRWELPYSRATAYLRISMERSVGFGLPPMQEMRTPNSISVFATSMGAVFEGTGRRRFGTTSVRQRKVSHTPSTTSGYPTFAAMELEGT